MDADFLATDVQGNVTYMDVTNFQNCLSVVQKFDPDYVLNISGLKYVTRSEHQTIRTTEINIDGTPDLIQAASAKKKIVLTSTCKSCNPETVYGATKLIA